MMRIGVLVGAGDGEPGAVGTPVEGSDVGQRDPSLERPRVEAPDLHLAILLRSERQQPARRVEREVAGSEAGRRRDLVQATAVGRRVDPDETVVGNEERRPVRQELRLAPEPVQLEREQLGGGRHVPHRDAVVVVAVLADADGDAASGHRG